MTRFPPEVASAIDDARALQAEVDAGVAKDVPGRAAAALKTLDRYCTGPEAAERSRAVIDALNQVEVAW